MREHASTFPLGSRHRLNRVFFGLFDANLGLAHPRISAASPTSPKTTRVLSTGLSGNWRSGLKQFPKIRSRLVTLMPPAHSRRCPDLHLDPHPLAQNRRRGGDPVVVHADRGSCAHCRGAGSHKGCSREQGPGAFKTGMTTSRKRLQASLPGKCARGCHLFESRVFISKTRSPVVSRSGFSRPQDPETCELSPSK